MAGLRIAPLFSGSSLSILCMYPWKYATLSFLLVFRGFHDDGDKIQINTDVRTRKVVPLPIGFLFLLIISTDRFLLWEGKEKGRSF